MIRATVFVLLAASCVAQESPVKVLLCTGDYGMWAQDRAKQIMAAVEKAAPGKAVFEVEQSYNFVRKLEAPGYAARFDAIVCGDVGLGQMTTPAQEAIVRFVEAGGGFIYVVEGKSTLPVNAPRECDPLPLAAVLPYAFPACNPAKDARPDARALQLDDTLFTGLDFAKTPAKVRPDGKPVKPAPLALERPHSKGRVLALFGAFGASYRYVSYAKFEKSPGGWDEWAGWGELWSRLLTRTAEQSPVCGRTRADVDAAAKTVPCVVRAGTDATREVDDLRASVFSIVALSQLYEEDGGAGEDLFLDLNPRDWFDRSSDKVLSSKKGKAFPDKTELFRKFHIKGILHGDNSYGSYGNWDEAKWKGEIARLAAKAKEYPDFLAFLQPGNEPPCDEKYFAFYNRLATSVLKEAPNLKVIGPGVAFNLSGCDERKMKAFIATCGANTDVLNWHIYARCPASVREEVKYWTRFAEGKLRSKGPVRVMFTEADTWNTRESQFNYLMERAFTFLPMPEILACFQYCMRPRYEGGTYWFGVLMPGASKDEFMANYNAHWIFRGLRGRIVETKLEATPEQALPHVKVLASSADGGQSVTVVAYYDTGCFDGPAAVRADEARVELSVKLPAGNYKLQRSHATWLERETADGGQASGSASVTVSLKPCEAAAFTWTRQ